jgi:hypothetical protein
MRLCLSSVAAPTLAAGLIAVGALLYACGSTHGGTAAPAPDASDDVDEGGSPADAAGPDDAGPDVDHGSPSSVYPAPHATPPTVVDVGGDVLATPKIVPITFAGQSTAADIDAFAAAVGTSAFWTAATKEYGVGAASAAAPIHLATAAPTSITDAAIQAWMQSNLQGATPAWGAPDKNAIYTVFYPPTTVLTAPALANMCTNGAYHSEFALNDGTPIVYAVVAGCQKEGIDPWSAPTGTDLTTFNASHEWIEAATDPHPNSNPAYYQTDDDHLSWLVVPPGGELADMCAFNPGAALLPSGFAHPVQRSWSNASVLAGHDPCVPHASAQPYFNSAPVLGDTITFEFSGQKITTKGVHIPVGGTKTVEVDLYSDGPTSGPWTLTAFDPLTWIQQKPELDFSFDRASGVNGEKVYLTIKVLKKDPSYGAEMLAITSTLGNEKNIWFGAVGN